MLHIVFAQAEMRVLAIATGEAEAQLLGVSVGSRLLERVINLYPSEGRGVLCGSLYFSSDRYTYRVSVIP